MVAADILNPARRSENSLFRVIWKFRVVTRGPESRPECGSCTRDAALHARRRHFCGSSRPAIEGKTLEIYQLKQWRGSRCSFMTVLRPILETLIETNCRPQKKTKTACLAPPVLGTSDRAGLFDLP